MKKEIIKILLLNFVILLYTTVFCLLSYGAGKKDKETEIKNRATKYISPKEDNTKIELIIFGESQL